MDMQVRRGVCGGGGMSEFNLSEKIVGSLTINNMIYAKRAINVEDVKEFIRLLKILPMCFNVQRKEIGKYIDKLAGDNLK